MERAILRYCDDLIDVITEGTPVGLADLSAQYGRPLPLLVAGRLFGIGIDRGDDMVMDLWRMLDGPDSAGAFQRLHRTFLELVTAKRRMPGEDVPSYLFAAKPTTPYAAPARTCHGARARTDARAGGWPPRSRRSPCAGCSSGSRR
ncbi:hypothetical protein AB0O28_08050 [Microbispora sp. NPDC088329]|uniref:hypothetical protein n=1 Tax=Microbispora sp. NPDC088329 TaxID=3154869 RepID=UPI00342B5913